MATLALAAARRPAAASLVLATAGTPGRRRRCCCFFSVFSRPPPNYPGHVPLTVLERAALAVGAGVISLANPRRGGKELSLAALRVLLLWLTDARLRRQI